VVITIGIARADLQPLFGSVHRAGVVRSPWSVEEERELTILVAREPRRSLQQV
jgi:hypothetical protein